MNKQPIQPFLVVASILNMIQSILYLVLVAISSVIMSHPVLLVAVGVSGFNTQIEPLDMLNLVVTCVCYVISIVLVIMALMHKNMKVISRIASFVLSFLLVFSVIDMDSFTDFGSYFMILLGAVIPALFYYATYKQNQIDNGGK